VKDHKTKDTTTRRKKRASWGRRMHPELIQSEGRIQSGTLEAPVHEIVFATTFSNPAAPSDDDAGNYYIARRPRTVRERVHSMLLLSCWRGAGKYGGECQLVMNGIYRPYAHIPDPNISMSGSKLASCAVLLVMTIQAALCSRPVARLEKAWKRADVNARAAVESWVFPGPD